MSIVALRARGSGASASTAAPDAVAAAASRRSMGWADITIPRFVDTRACLRLRSDRLAYRRRLRRYDGSCIKVKGVLAMPRSGKEGLSGILETVTNRTFE